MPSRSEALLGDLGADLSSQLSLMRSSYDSSTVIPLSRIITHGGDFWSLGVKYSCSNSSGTGDSAILYIVDNEVGILLMVPRFGISFCLIDIRLPGGKGS